MPAPNAGPAAPQREKKWRVDLLDVDAPVLDSFDALSELDHFARRPSGSEYGRSLINFMNRPRPENAAEL